MEVKSGNAFNRILFIFLTGLLSSMSFETAQIDKGRFNF